MKDAKGTENGTLWELVAPLFRRYRKGLVIILMGKSLLEAGFSIQPVRVLATANG